MSGPVHQSRLTPTGVTNKMYLKKTRLSQPMQIIIPIPHQQPTTSPEEASMIFPYASQPSNT